MRSIRFETKCPKIRSEKPKAVALPGSSGIFGVVLWKLMFSLLTTSLLLFVRFSVR
jgi:hypothetical protein